MDKKIAIVYDWMDKWGGVERLLLVLNNMFPHASFFTSHADLRLSWLKNFTIQTSFMQKFPDFIKSNRLLSAFFYPFAFESFDLSNYDIVISVSSSFAKAVITKPYTKHINIMLSPTRFLWSHQNEYISQPVNTILKPYIKHLKAWDKIVAKRPDKIISISQFIKKQCLKFYGLKSSVIYPPFDIDYWLKIKNSIDTLPNSFISLPKNSYFLIVSRLEPYKRLDIPIKVISSVKKDKLVVIGKGTQKKKLQKIAGKNITFIDSCSDTELASYYRHAKALLMPQQEDFGYVSLEAQFFCCPIISYKKSGAAETIIHKKTGLLFEKQTPESFYQALDNFSSLSYTIKKFLEKNTIQYFLPFSKKKFIAKFKSLLNFNNKI